MFAPLGPGEVEVTRQRLIDRLADRWRSPLLLVEAPGGYGKSVALSQAIRDNAIDPSGIDHYVSCHVGSTVASLASELLDEVGSDGTDLVRDADPAEAGRVIALQLATRAPSDVCLLVDDVHHLDPVDLGVFVEKLLANRPDNGHLVLAGRRIGDLVDLLDPGAAHLIDHHDLQFDADEVSAFATASAVPSSTFATAGGWPAMLRLAVLAADGTRPEDLLADVIDRLTPEQRTALAVVVLGGRVTDAELAELGCRADLAELRRNVPLLVEMGEGTIAAHDLWGDHLDRLMSASELRRRSTEVARWHLEHRRWDEAIRIAASAGSFDVAREAVANAIGDGEVTFTQRLLEQWIEQVEVDDSDEPEVLLLKGVLDRLVSGAEASTGLLRTAAHEFRSRGQVEFEAIALFELGTVAWIKGDQDVLVETVLRGVELAQQGVERARVLGRLGESAAADIGGDSRAAADILLEIDVDHPSLSLPPTVLDLVLRSRSSLSFLVGRADQGLRDALALRKLGSGPVTEYTVVCAHWQYGDPRPVIDAWPDLRSLSDAHGNAHAAFQFAVYRNMIAASLGHAADLDLIDEHAWERGRDRSFATLARAAAAVVEHREDDAANLIDDHLAGVDPEDQLTLGEYRRFLSYGYVLSEDARRHLAASTGLGAKFVQRRALAAQFVALRDNEAIDPESVPHAGELVCAFPLPWSVEFVARLATRHEDLALDRADEILELIGARAQAEFRRLAAGPDGRAATGAQQVLAAVPTPPDETLVVRVCGPLTAEIDDPDRRLARLRVRQVLALLILRGTVRREETAELLWPDLDAKARANNLRITLSHVRHLLEGDRIGREAPFHLRTRGDRITLHDSDRLGIDVRTIERLLDRATRLDRSGDQAAAAAARFRAVALWTDEAFVELRDFVELAPDLAAFDGSMVEAATAAGTWAASTGDVEASRAIGTRILRHDPYAETAYQLLVNASLVEGDLDRARTELDACGAALDELNVQPTAAIGMLERRLALRSAGR